jgi:hypothetical protein
MWMIFTRRYWSANTWPGTFFDAGRAVDDAQVALAAHLLQRGPGRAERGNGAHRRELVSSQPIFSSCSWKNIMIAVAIARPSVLRICRF